MAADDLAAVGQALGLALDELGVGAYFVVLYRLPESVASAPPLLGHVDSDFGHNVADAELSAACGGPPARKAVLVLAREAARAAVSAVASAQFDPRKLLPDEILAKQTPFAFVAEPLFLGSDPIGYGLFDCTFEAGTFYDDVRQVLSSTLKRLEREAVLANLHRVEKERSKALEQAYLLMRQNQERLVLSENMAALGRLTAGMAHEMNTPLAAVRMALDELAKLTEEYQSSLGDSEVSIDDHRQIAKEMRATVALADGAADRVASFVKGIHFQTKHVGTDARRFNAVVVIEDTLLLLRHALRKSGCSVSFEPTVPEVPLYGSPGRLAQVVTNLVTNAVDASTDRGAPPILIRLLPSEGHVVLTIADGGSGIAAEDLQRIFDPMFTTKPFGEGTGLGLSIVHTIVVNDFHGAIEVDSELNRGTTFTLHLFDSRGAGA